MDQIKDRIGRYTADEGVFVFNRISRQCAFERAATGGEVTDSELRSLNETLANCGIPVTVPRQPWQRVSEEEVRTACAELLKLHHAMINPAR